MNEETLKQIVTRYENASFLVNRRLNVLLREVVSTDLTVDQVFMIRYIGARNACTSSELSDAFCVGKSSITAIITRLVDKGLIRRYPDDKDRRVTYLTLTEDGVRAVEQSVDGIQHMLTRYLTQFDEQEAETFIATYEKLAKVLAEG
ncbi:MAG: transcriptional regulator, MarR family [Paenibacillus sp.]|nr:transcriptional regulator, MarR family [Paenibacillus sp.]